MPHAADTAIKTDWMKPRPYPVVYFGTYFDDDFIKKTKKKFPQWAQKPIDQTIEKVLSDDRTSHHVAFLAACRLSQIPSSDVASLPFSDLMHFLEYVIRQKDRVELIRGIKKHEVHLFGDGSGGPFNWQEAFKNQSNVIVHPAVTFEKALEIAKAHQKLSFHLPLPLKKGVMKEFFTLTWGEPVLLPLKMFF